MTKWRNDEILKYYVICAAVSALSWLSQFCTSKNRFRENSKFRHFVTYQITFLLTCQPHNNKKQHTLYILSDYLAWETLAASMTSTASTTSVASMTSSASFHQKNYWAWFFHQPWYQNNLICSDNVDWIIKNSIFSWFLTPFLCWGCGGQGCYFYQIKES